MAFRLMSYCRDASHGFEDQKKAMLTNRFPLMLSPEHLNVNPSNGFCGACELHEICVGLTSRTRFSLRTRIWIDLSDSLPVFRMFYVASPT